MKRIENSESAGAPYYLREEDPEKFLEVYLYKYQTTYYIRKVREVMRLIPADLVGKRFLDVGCCGGYFSVKLAKMGARGIGLDASIHAVKAATLYAEKAGVTEKIEFSTGDLTEMRFSEKFDLIIAKDVIEHIKDDIRFLSILSNLLTAKGQLIITTQNAASFNYVFEGMIRKIINPGKKWIGWDPTHVRWYTPWSLRRKLRMVGLIAERFSGSYYMPYVHIYKELLKRDLGGGIVTFIDDFLGGYWPFNRMGWSISVLASSRKKEQ